ncbi:glycosyltransferase family 2 protein [Dokdonia sp. 4H-3-7-5]|uniref:glycosyltransferase family 2 protein n=2 Tax=unclassified Dokdonia TaxID=2615033 RepID=UPI00059D827E|nr:glycosyltransferase family A protein [Dokdonia sp. 4H-3-7-5]
MESTVQAVTVVIPCYNDGAFIMDALNSILRQTVLPERIIIIDDGSGAETMSVLKSIKNNIVEVVYQTNQGVCTARNNGIGKATSSYILTLDADDIFEPTFIEKAKHILDSDMKVGVVCCHYKEFGNSSKNKDIIKPKGKITQDFLVKNNGVASALFRKKCWEEVNGYDVNFDKGYEDWDFWLSVLSQGWEMRIIQEPLFNYRKKIHSRDTMALAQFDKELKMKIFLKHKKVYESSIDVFAQQMILRNTMLVTNLNKTKEGLEFQLGKIILKPIRIIKRLLFPSNE